MSIFNTLLNNSPGELSHTSTSPTSDKYSKKEVSFSEFETPIDGTTATATCQLSSLITSSASIGLSNSYMYGSIDTSSVSSNPYYSNIYNGNYNGNYIGSFTSNMWKTSEELNQLESMSYIVDFELDDGSLSKSLCEITDNSFIFDCKMDGNRIQPYDKIKMSVKIEISDVLTLHYTNLQFTKIENNFKFKNGYCSLSKLKVNFKFEQVLYENEKLSIKEKRADKLNNILKNNE